MKSLALIGILALGLCGCGKKPSTAEVSQDNTTTRMTPSAVQKSRPSLFPRTQPRAFDPAKATPEELAAKQRLEERLAQAAIEKKERDAARVVEREQRLVQMTEQMTTRLREADVNGDGLLAQAEVTGPFERRFAESDTNNDGQLNAAEQQAMLESLRERMQEAGGRRGGAGPGGGGRDRGGRR